MTLAAGTRLGPYEIVAPLGAGGMGEVYRARDTRLRREVAVKVLPDAVAADTDRLRRFEQEALATAALNHPNILAVYDIGREGGRAYVVAELLEGGTLREALVDALPVRRVVDVAIQIAAGLAAAHDRGIVHRDLKPENVFVTRDGRVKILDFGLARVTPAPSADTSTGLAGGTEPGVVMGTVGYMAPEQVRGQAVDHRADIFSFGTVVYELLSGRRAFGGDTTADTMTAILREHPPEAGSLGRAVPAGLDRIVSRCLEKAPAARFQSASDLAFALQALAGESASGVTPAARGPSLSRRAALALVTGAAGVALGALAVWFLRAPAATPAQAPVRFTISAASGVAIDDLMRAVVSPDSQWLAFVENSAAGRHLAILSLRDGAKRSLGVEGLGTIGWSPDSRSLAFFGRNRELYRIGVDGGHLLRLAELGWTPGAIAWRGDHSVVLLVGATGVVTEVPAGGGLVRELLPIERGVKPWGFVQVLPDRRRLLLSRHGRPNEILVTSADGSGEELVLGQGAYAHFFEPDYLLAMRDSQLVAWRTDLRQPLSSQPEVLVDDVLVRQGMAIAPFSASGSVLAFRTDSQEARTRLAWFDRTGRESEPLALRAHCRNPELAPDFGRVAVECWDRGGGRDIWVYDLERDAATRLTSDPADDADPVWAADGRTIYFASTRLGPADVFRTAAGGGGGEALVAKTPGATPVMAMTPDGAGLLLLSSATDSGAPRATGLDLALVRLSDQAFAPALDGPASEIEGQFSPDGRLLLYGSDQTGHFEVYVEPWPRTGERWAVSTGGGSDGRWRPDGGEIFYLAPDRRLMAVAVTRTGGFRAGRPVELFRTRVAGPLAVGHRFPYAVSKDGQRFLMYVTDPDGPPPALSVIVNWPALLARR